MWLYDKEGNVLHEEHFVTLENQHRYTYNEVKKKILSLRPILKDRTYRSKLEIDQIIVILCLMILTASRVSEILRLRYMDLEINLEKKLIIVHQRNLKNKNKIIKTYPILLDSDKNPDMDIVKPIVDYYSLYTNLIFKSKGKLNDESKLFGNITRFIIYKTTKDFLKLNPHGLRHIRLQHLAVTEKKNLKIVQKIAGHSTLRLLDRYIAVDTDDISSELYK